MSARLSRLDRSTTRTRNTPTAQRVTSRFTVRGRVPFSSVDIKAGANIAAQVQTTHGQRINVMRSNTRKRLHIVPGIVLGLLLFAGLASATTGEDAGDYTITSSIEFGYRGIRVDGDEQKYRSDLNYKAGPRIFDSSFLMQSKDGKGSLFDTLLVTASGWGADPTGSMRFSAEKPKWYRFEGIYRRAKYYRFLNNIANPNWLFSSFPVPPNPVTGLHGYNTRTEFGDFDLTILPKNELVRLNFGYS